MYLCIFHQCQQKFIKKKNANKFREENHNQEQHIATFNVSSNITLISSKKVQFENATMSSNSLIFKSLIYLNLWETC